MKKISIILGVFSLFVCLSATAGYAFTGSQDHFMRVEGRDAFNNPVSSEIFFEESAFSIAYSMLTPEGAVRWHRSNDNAGTRMCTDNSFKVPFVAMPFLYNTTRLNRSLRPSERKSQNKLYLNFLLLNFVLCMVLVFESNLQSKKEPRFRVPVLIE